MLKISTQDGVKNVKKISVAAEKKNHSFLSRFYRVTLNLADRSLGR